MAQHKRYPMEYKLDAVRLVLEQGYSLKAAGDWSWLHPMAEMT